MDYKKHPEKQPGRKSKQAFFIGLVVALSATLVAFEYKTYQLKIPEVFEASDVSFEEEKTPIVILEEQKPKELPPPKVTKALPQVVLDPKPQIVFKVVQSPSVDVDPYDIEPFEPEPTEPEVVTTQFPSVQPEFIGGQDAMYKFLGENINYPAIARDNGIEGKVYLQFIVNTDGTISDVKLLRAQNELLVKEAIRVVKKMPKWKPGRQGGRKVRVIYTLPIQFALK